MVKFTLDLVNPPPLTKKQLADLEALGKMPDSEIDYSDIPFEPLYRPAKKMTTVRLDVDVLALAPCPGQRLSEQNKRHFAQRNVGGQNRRRFDGRHEITEESRPRDRQGFALDPKCLPPSGSAGAVRPASQSAGGGGSLIESISVLILSAHCGSSS